MLEFVLHKPTDPEAERIWNSCQLLTKTPKKDGINNYHRVKQTTRGAFGGKNKRKKI